MSSMDGCDSCYDINGAKTIDDNTLWISEWFCEVE